MKVVQQIRGSEAVEDARILPPGVITVDTDSWVIRVHDGVTPGGHKQALDSALGLSHAREFISAVIKSIPGLTGDIAGVFVEFSVAGNYTIPALADIPLVGGGFYVQATTAGVILDRAGADLISDKGVDVTSLALVDKEVVRIVKKSAARYVVLGRY